MNKTAGVKVCVFSNLKLTIPDKNPLGKFSADNAKIL